MNPDDEFWAHCSNLQSWYENGYNSRLLHRNLAFPILKELINVGDLKAKQILKEEIIDRIASGNTSVITYLIVENYLEYFNSNDWETILLDPELQIIKKLIMNLDPLFRIDEMVADNIVEMIENLAKEHEIKKRLGIDINNLIVKENDIVLVEILSYKLYRYIGLESLNKLIISANSKLIYNIKEILFGIERKYSKNFPYVFSQLLIFFAYIHRKLGKENLLKLINFFNVTQKKNLKERIITESKKPIDFLKNDIHIQDFLIKWL